MLKTVLCPIHKDGWLFIAIFAAISLILGLIAESLGWIGAILTGWCVTFFRDPDRVVPLREGLVLSPADGIVSAITTTALPGELGLGKGEWTRISVFLNVFNVHVNRIPIKGKILKSIYHPGKFFNASLDKSSKDNERQLLVVETQDKKHIAFVQIAGLIARRIRCDVREGEQVLSGQRFGMIRFGSRADVYLPKGINPLVVVGQKMVAGETILADLKSKEEPRTGEIR
jgi:phosphatidylserine decarboxylase